MTDARLIPVDIVRADEPWTEIVLADGATLRIKLTVAQALRVHGPDGKPASGPDGRPVYVLHHQVTQPILLVPVTPVEVMLPKVKRRTD